MDKLLMIYPEQCHENIRRIVRAVGTSPETAYAMMLMTATLMDLHPDDGKVAEMILDDFGRMECEAT